MPSNNPLHPRIIIELQKELQYYTRQLTKSPSYGKQYAKWTGNHLYILVAAIVFTPLQSWVLAHQQHTQSSDRSTKSIIPE